MTDAPELKPCPFCGGDADLMTPEDDNMRLATAMCMGCYITGPEKETGAEAITAWNTRADLAKPRVKPLVWDDRKTTEMMFQYRVHIGYGLMNGIFALTLSGSSIGEFDSEEDAKAAAQADYESRVLACLEGYGDE